MSSSIETYFSKAQCNDTYGNINLNWNFSLPKEERVSFLKKLDAITDDGIEQKKHMLNIIFSPPEAAISYKKLLSRGFSFHHANSKEVQFSKCLKNHSTEQCAYPKYQTAYPAVTMIVFNQTLQKVLLIQEKKGPTMGKWKPPTGTVDINEEPKETAVRELMEETGIDVKDITPKFTGHYYGKNFRGESPDINFAFAFILPETTQISLQKQELVKWEWMPVSHYLKESESYTKPGSDGVTKSWIMRQLVENAFEALKSGKEWSEMECSYLSGKPATAFGPIAH